MSFHSFLIIFKFVFDFSYFISFHLFLITFAFRKLIFDFSVSFRSTTVQWQRTNGKQNRSKKTIKRSRQSQKKKFNNINKKNDNFIEENVVEKKNNQNEKSKHNIKKNESGEENDSDKIQSNQIWKKNDSIELLSDMKNWKFCRNYNWIFKNNDVSSKNTIFDDKLIVKIIESNLFKDEMHRKWNYTFNSKNNLNESIDETETSAKIKFEKQWYYVSVKKYIMYENENSYIDAKRKDSTTKIDDDSTRNLLCFKSQKKKLSKNYIKTKRILHETTNKKNPNFFSRMKSFKSKKKFFDNKKKFSVDKNKENSSTNKKKWIKKNSSTCKIITEMNCE